MSNDSLFLSVTRFVQTYLPLTQSSSSIDSKRYKIFIDGDSEISIGIPELPFMVNVWLVLFALIVQMNKWITVSVVHSFCKLIKDKLPKSVSISFVASDIVSLNQTKLTCQTWNDFELTWYQTSKAYKATSFFPKKDSLGNALVQGGGSVELKNDQNRPQNTTRICSIFGNFESSNDLFYSF